MRIIYTQIILKFTILSIRSDNSFHDTKIVNLDILQLDSMQRSLCGLNWGKQKLSSLTNNFFIDPTKEPKIIFSLPEHSKLS